MRVNETQPELIRVNLKNKVALVNGAGSAPSGVSNGMAAAVAYAASGAQVVVVDISPEAADRTLSRIHDLGGEAIAHIADVSDQQALEDVVATCKKTYGGIDILHHNVGISALGGPVDLSLDDWQKVINVNLTSLFLACKYIIPVMQERGGGVITAISSLAAIRWVGTPFIAYATTKAAILQFIGSVALQYAGHNIRANSILPGLIDTPLAYAALGAASDEEKEALRAVRNASSPTGKMGSPWDIANLSVFLASDQAGFITGTTQIADGGMSLQTSANR